MTVSRKGALQLRKAVQGDIAGIIKIVDRVIPLMLQQGNPQWELNKYPLACHFQADIDDGTLWIAVTEEKVVGVTAITTDQSLYGACLDISQKSIVPHRVAVLPEYQRLGVAKALLGKAEEVSKDCGYMRIRVDTHTNNPSMKRMLMSLHYSFIANITKPTKFPLSENFCVFEKILKL